MSIVAFLSCQLLPAVIGGGADGKVDAAVTTQPLMSCSGRTVEENLKLAKSYFTTDIAAGRDPAVPFRYVERTWIICEQTKMSRVLEQIL
jgi:hypothetical protein